MLLVGSKEGERGRLAKGTWDLSFAFCSAYFATSALITDGPPGFPREGASHLAVTHRSSHTLCQICLRRPVHIWEFPFSVFFQ